MSVDIFLKLDSITGESQDKTHTGEIDLLAWSWGASQSGTMHMGSGGGSGKASFQDISATKYVDKSSATLWQKLSKGEHIKTGTLTVRKAGGKPLEYIVIDLTNIIITSISTGGSGGEDRLTENVSLNFEEFHITYKEQKEDGAPAKIPDFKWNIAKNAEAP
ncbi:MAG: type VI secretion system tube protein Hcp [Nitrococcus sp.]|nr:type VI secretion system tube protein Hcp [Nitrococcus sp.]